MTKAQRERAKANLRGLERQLAIVHDLSLPIGRRKRASRCAARLAERLGFLERPEKCEFCGRRPARGQVLERHHPQHDRPLEVWFLCCGCHQEANGMAWIQATA